MNTLARGLRAAIVTGAVLVSGGCATQVTRISPDQQIDLSGRWNDVDSRQVADAMVRQSVAGETGSGWALQYMQAHGGRKPTLIVGSIRNRSMEHIPVQTFVRDIERAYLGSGQVQVVASAEERQEVRDERVDQQEHAAADTRARLAREHGAQYMLQGDISQITDREGGRRVVYYQVDMTLVDLETNAKTWTGQHKIKKIVEQPRFRL
ncbi:MAG TPA: penicillin-binding protein activator LpoB [Longimicrobium sp.]|nr:penicillin-binding protein activator LpoB [Longimicrobium sp.]